MSVFLRRSKSHAAVTHHRCGDAVPTGGSEPWIPCGLRVVVGVDVYPAWSEEKTVCVDDAMCVSCGGFGCGVDGGDDAVLEGDVCLCFWVARAVNESCVSDDGFLLVSSELRIGTRHGFHRSGRENAV